ncbi:helicase-related protein [Bacteroides sp.]|uniref:helicase-related protein n=1 Tax=Bacteroides sp. TaxID=29523 RepID=UPI0026352202|nr:helicase-related protein [Bacteroides sp.]MDD3040435.1 hypothetical protein [Bacteroides sp.]
MMKFWENNGPEVFSDFIVLGSSHDVAAISMIGTEISVKAYRAKFTDNVLARRSLPFYCDGVKNNRVFKPITTFRLFPQVKTSQGLQVLMVDQNLIWGLTTQDIRIKLYQHLHDLNIPCPTPEEDYFEPCMDSLLDAAVNSGYFGRTSVIGDVKTEDMKFYTLNSYYTSDFRESAEEIIAEYIVGDNTPEEFLEGIQGVADYIERYAIDIGEKIGNRVTYLHTPGNFDNSLFENLGRKLFPQQKDVAVAASKRLDNSNHVIISGQMGVGKTSIGTAVCHYHRNGKPYRTIVTCPSHLVEKWSREIKTIIPEAKTFMFLSGNQQPWSQFYSQWRYSGKLEAPEFWIVSNEALRGGYILRPGINVRKRKAYDAEFECYRWMDVAVCPKCGKVLTYPIKDSDGDTIYVTMTPDDFKCHTARNHKCRNKIKTPEGDEIPCEEVLWQADNNRKGYRKVSIADIVKKKIPKGFFNYYIGDEFHKYKGSTAQGLAYGGVISKVDKLIAMTGTLADGYANGLYYLLWRMSPNQFKGKGYKHDEESRAKFQNEYGFWIKTIKVKDSEYGKSSRAKNTRATVKPLPGYTINTFPEWLIEKTVFLKLSDVAPFLPPKNEFVNVVEMDEDLEANYREIEGRLKEEIKEGGSQVASIMLHTCLSYLDVAEGPEIIQVVKPEYQLYFPVPQLNKDKLYNKERELQTIIRSELSLNRKCLVFTTYTNLRDCLPRLEWVASQVEGAKVQVMRSNTVSTGKREAWVKDKLNKTGVNVLICHPELVETGLDLIECQTIIWIQTGYIPSTVRQASARGLRIGQTDEVKIIFLCYRNTLQEKCFQLIGSKLNAAGILEGHLSNEGLRNFGNDGGSFSDVLSLLKDNIASVNSNDIFESYKAEVAQLLNKPNLSHQESTRLVTLVEVLTQEDINVTHLSSYQKKKLMQGADSQLLLFA